MKNKKNIWVKIPGDPYALSLYDLTSIAEAKAYVRDMLNVKRLPNGTEFWIGE